MRRQKAGRGMVGRKQVGRRSDSGLLSAAADDTTSRVLVTGGVLDNPNTNSYKRNPWPPSLGHMPPLPVQAHRRPTRPAIHLVSNAIYYHRFDIHQQENSFLNCTKSNYQCAVPAYRQYMLHTTRRLDTLCYQSELLGSTPPQP